MPYSGNTIVATEIPDGPLSSTLVTVASSSISSLAADPASILSWTVPAIPAAGMFGFAVYQYAKGKIATFKGRAGEAVDKLLQDIDDLNGRAVTDDDLSKLKGHHQPFQRLARRKKPKALRITLLTVADELDAVGNIGKPDDPGDPSQDTRYQQQLGEVIGRLKTAAEQAHDIVNR